TDLRGGRPLAPTVRRWRSTGQLVSEVAGALRSDSKVRNSTDADQEILGDGVANSDLERYIINQSVT
ncbi:MAG: hypothetical protein ACYDC0_00880, partial [Acidimicrobiales bacterium]